MHQQLKLAGGSGRKPMWERARSVNKTHIVLISARRVHWCIAVRRPLAILHFHYPVIRPTEHFNNEKWKAHARGRERVARGAHCMRCLHFDFDKSKLQCRLCHGLCQKVQCQVHKYPGRTSRLPGFLLRKRKLLTESLPTEWVIQWSPSIRAAIDCEPIFFS